MSIGDNIRRARLARGMTQEQLGKRAGGRSVNQMNGYERNRSRPSPPVLADIARALGVTAEELSGQPVANVDGELSALMGKAKARAVEIAPPNAAVRVVVEIVL